MKTKTLRNLLLGTMAMLSASAMADTTIVGAEDNSAAFWTAFSNYYTIQADETLTLEFDNYTDKTQNWHNWLAVVTTDADRGADGYSEYVVLRADNYAWQYALNTGPDSSHDWYTSLTSNYNWETFLADMDGAHVVMTVKRLGATVTINADMTTTGGNSYNEQFVIECGDGTQPIRTFLSTEGGHLVIDNDKTKIATSEVPYPTISSNVAPEDNTAPFWTYFSNYYTIPANQTLTLEFQNFSNMTANYKNWIGAVTTNADRGAEGYSEYVVLRADNYAWQYALNTGPDSSHDWYTSLESNYNWETFLADMNGANVVMTVARQGATVTINADITASSNTKYFEKFVIDCGDGSQDIRFFLTTEAGHLVIDDTKTRIEETVVTAIERHVPDGIASEAPAYTLGGVKATNSQHGIIVSNGRKVIK